MTVSYSRLVANGSSFGCFWSILCKWRGSVYKLIWRELIAYLCVYFTINLIYRFALNESQQRTFEMIRLYFTKTSENVPITFILGFYVSLVVKRWWDQYRLLPWPDTLALFVSAAIPGVDERGRLMRRNIVRYAVLAYVITLKHVSVRVKKRFPTLQHVVDAGFMMESEKKIVEMMDERSPMAKYWMPLVWATNIINRARKDSLISSDHVVQTLLMELSEHRRRLGSIISYDTVCVPLVYTQLQTQESRSEGNGINDWMLQFSNLLYVGLVLRGYSFVFLYLYKHLKETAAQSLMMESEKKIFELMDERHPMTKYWLPLTWATNIINRARREGLIPSDHMVQTILLEMSDIRWRLGSLIGYDNVTVPLVYTQVVTLSVYSYFLAALMGRQFIINKNPNVTEEPDVYFPFFTTLQFCFYIGWLKVAEVLIGPFGEDDDDIELNWLIDRHIKAAYMIVDEMHEEHPELLKDQYWDDVVPKDLPYTVASEHYRRYEPKGSAEFYKVKESDALYANLMNSRKSVNHDDVYADYESVDTPLVERRKNWFQRQMQRVGSIRSSSTTYSSGLFRRPRHNSVYSSPDNGAVLPVTIHGAGNNNNNNPGNPHKMSIYDRIIRRKSTRQTRPGKMNGSVQGMKNRPRIPTPDVSKEPSDKDGKLANMVNNHNHPQSYPINTELPVVQVVLSPIQELEGHQSTVTSITSNSSGTAALAQAVLSPTLSSAGLTGVTVPTTPVTVAVSPVTLTTVSMTQPLLTSLGINRSQSPTSSLNPPIVLTEVPQLEKDDSACGGSSSGSISGGEDRSRKASVASKRGEVYV